LGKNKKITISESTLNARLFLLQSRVDPDIASIIADIRVILHHLGYDEMISSINGLIDYIQWKQRDVKPEVNPDKNLRLCSVCRNYCHKSKVAPHKYSRNSDGRKVAVYVCFKCRLLISKNR
jgi:hypothetical protein